MEDFKVTLSYKLSGTQALDAKNLSILHNELKDLGNVEIDQNEGPQAGGVVDAFLTFLFNEELKEVLKFIFEIYAGDILLNGSNSVVAKKLEKLFAAFIKIENSEQNWDYISIDFQFSNTKIIIYGWNQMFTSKISLVTSQLIEHYDNLNRPQKIIVPIGLDRDEEDKEYFYEYRGEEFDLIEYSKYWGIIDQAGNKSIYSIEKRLFINKIWI
jgi:hypothetical protein